MAEVSAYSEWMNSVGDEVESFVFVDRIGADPVLQGAKVWPMWRRSGGAQAGDYSVLWDGPKFFPSWTYVTSTVYSFESEKENPRRNSMSKFTEGPQRTQRRAA